MAGPALLLQTLCPPGQRSLCSIPVQHPICSMSGCLRLLIRRPVPVSSHLLIFHCVNEEGKLVCYLMQTSKTATLAIMTLVHPSSDQQ